jgi:hypothetical protein
MTEPIPFRIILWAPDAYLKSSIVTCSSTSFLPLDGGATTVSEDAGPVRVHVVRRIGADPRSTFVMVVGRLRVGLTRRTG